MQKLGVIGTVLSAIVIAATLEEVDIVGESLSVPESLLLSPATGSVMMGGFWSASPAIVRGAKAVQRAVNGGVKRLECESVK
jgi:hypothetical protein